VPVYTTCPHCHHPMVVPGRARGKGRLCRQCGQGYRVSRFTAATLPLPAHSTGEMLRLTRRPMQPAVLVIS
jgi:hypothetical protein